jgi:hypothetical protein
MKYLKKWKLFLEDGLSSTTSGMGDISSSQPGSLPGTTGDEGSGDLGFTFKKEKREKGDPTKVTDMRDLETSKEITHVEEIKESEMIVRDPKYNKLISDMINDCVVELCDEDFELTMMKYDKDIVDNDFLNSDGGYIDYEELRISLHKLISQNWTGNYSIGCRFDKDGETSRKIITLRGRGSEMTDEEQMLFDMAEDSSIKLINSLDYQYGFFNIEWLVAGSGMPYNTDRNINVNVSFVLYNDLKN